MRLISTPIEIPARYNVAPQQNAPVVRGPRDARTLEFLRWGLIPFWAKDPSIGNRTINARSETAAKSPAFREAFRKRRCLIPISGFYEWAVMEGSRGKQAWYITPATGDFLMLAGLWDRWTPPGEQESLETFTILTTSPNSLLEPIHNRMPVILSSDQFDFWQDPANSDPAVLMPLLAPSPPDTLRKIPVSAWVSKPAHEGPRCIEPQGEARGKTATGRDSEGSLFDRT